MSALDLSEADVARPAAFGASGVCLGIHPLSERPAPELVEDMLDQARAAERSGFDGATVSEHHRGLAGYMPQPLLVSNWILGETSRIWSGPNPTLLTLRNAGLFAEELAWSAARYPGRFGASIAAGYNRDDFEAVGMTNDNVAARFAELVSSLTRALSPAGPLEGDEAVEEWLRDPPPLLSAANSVEAALRAARAGMGLLLIGSDDAADRADRMVRAYRDARASGPIMWVRRAFLGATSSDAATALKESYRQWQSGSHGSVTDYVTGPPQKVAETLVGELTRLGPGSCLVVHLHVPGSAHSESLERIIRFGEEVIPLMRRALPGG